MQIRSMIITLIIGLLAGLLAKALMPGKDPGGLVITILLGIGGSVLGRFLGSLVFPYDFKEGLDVESIALATAGALLILALWRKLKG